MTARAIAAALVLALAVSPALAQGQKPAPAKKEQPAPKAPQKTESGTDPVVARVNGTAIYRSDLEALRSSLPPQVQQQPPEQLYPRLLEQAVALQLVTQTARKEKLNEEPRVKKLTALAEEQILQDAYFDGIMRKEITEAKLRARYDQTIKSAAPREEVHARHILVPTEDGGEADHRPAQEGRRLRQARSGEDHRSRRQELGRRSRLFRRGRHGAGIRQSRLRLEAGRVFADAGEDAVRLARHQGRRPPPIEAADLRGGRAQAGARDGAAALQRAGRSSSPPRPRSKYSTPTAASPRHGRPATPRRPSAPRLRPRSGRRPPRASPNSCRCRTARPAGRRRSRARRRWRPRPRIWGNSRG